MQDGSFVGLVLLCIVGPPCCVGLPPYTYVEALTVSSLRKESYFVGLLLCGATAVPLGGTRADAYHRTALLLCGTTAVPVYDART